jgi:hypothetical protein
MSTDVAAAVAVAVADCQRVAAVVVEAQRQHYCPVLPK